MKKIYCKPQIQTYVVSIESLLNTDSPGYASHDDIEAKESDFVEADMSETPLSYNSLWGDEEE